MKYQKSGSIRWLMLLSQVVLVAFVTQWLIAQYNDEKNLLKKDLTQQFINSKQQMMDSLIVVNIVNPILNDQKPFKVRLEFNDTLPEKGILRKRTINDTLLPRNTLVKPHFNKSSQEIEEMVTINPEKDSAKKDFLVHGVKMFVQKIESADKRSDSLQASFFYTHDTLIFKNIVKNNFAKAGYSFPLLWTSPTDSAIQDDLYLESNIFSKAYGVEVSNYQYYLIKKISPQLLFGLILLCLTGAAFLIAFRSLRNQMRLNILKNDFISNISHELKTPVSTVKVAVEALQDFDMKQDEVKSSEYLNMAAHEINRLELMINKVMNTSVLEYDKRLIQPEKTNLKELIDEVLKSMQLRLSQQKARVKFEYVDDAMYVNADRLHIQGVIINLIDNCIKYAGPDPVIDINLAQSNGRIYISVADNGPGIPEEYTGKVFEKFFRVPSNNRHNVKGYGLGLSYADMVMKQHNGKISIENIKDAGCKFTLHFPAEK